MAKYTDAIRNVIIAAFNAGDQPTEAQFTNWITRIQEGIDEHDHSGVANGDGIAVFAGAGIDVPDDWYLGIGAALERLVFDAAGDIVVMGANFGVGALAPESFVDFSRSDAVPDVSIICYDDDADEARLYLRKSDTDVIGSLVETDTNDWLGLIGFQGVNTGSNWGYGVYMYALQRAAAGASYVAAALLFNTYSSAAGNANHMVLDGLTAQTGFNVAPASIAGKVHIDQSDNGAATPVLVLDQADISEGTINFIASARGIITGATNSTQSVRVELGGVVYRLALYVDA